MASQNNSVCWDWARFPNFLLQGLIDKIAHSDKRQIQISVTFPTGAELGSHVRGGQRGGKISPPDETHDRGGGANRKLFENHL